MNIKARHLEALRNSGIKQLERMVWAYLRGDEPGWAFIEFCCTGKWINQIRPGTILTANGVRLLVDKLTCHRNPDLGYMLVRIDFRRLDYEPSPEELVPHYRRHSIRMPNFEPGIL